VYYGTDASKGRFIRFNAQGSTIGKLVSAPFEIRRGMPLVSLFVSTRRPNADSTFNALRVNVVLYSDSALTTQVGSSNSTFTPPPAAGTAWREDPYNPFPSGLPATANFAVVEISRAEINATYAIDCGDIFLVESSFAALYADAATLAQEYWHAASFATGWANGSLGSSWRGVQYMKDSMGFVRLRGMAYKSGGTATIFTLPTGYRPALDQSFGTVGDGAVATINVRSSGVVELGVGAAATYLNINATFDTR